MAAVLIIVQSDQGRVRDCNTGIGPGAASGLILIHDRPLQAGPGFDPGRLLTHPCGIKCRRPAHRSGTRRHLRLTSIVPNVHFDTSSDGVTGRGAARGQEVSDHSQKVCSGFPMLRPPVHAAGEGEARLGNFRFPAL